MAKRNLYKKTEFGVDFSCSAERIDDFLSGYLSAKTGKLVSGMHQMLSTEEMRTFADAIITLADCIDKEWTIEDKTDEVSKNP